MASDPLHNCNTVSGEKEPQHVQTASLHEGEGSHATKNLEHINGSTPKLTCNSEMWSLLDIFPAAGWWWEGRREQHEQSENQEGTGAGLRGPEP